MQAAFSETRTPRCLHELAVRTNAYGPACDRGRMALSFFNAQQQVYLLRTIRTTLFKNLVGASEKRGGYREAERLRSFQNSEEARSWSAFGSAILPLTLRTRSSVRGNF